MKTFSVLGIPIYSGTYKQLVNYIHQLIKSNRYSYICVMGVHGLMESNRNASVYSAHMHSDIVVPDGMPLVWLGRDSGYIKTTRIYGPDLFSYVCAYGNKHKLSIYLYGSTPIVLQLLSSYIHKHFPNIRLLGSYSPPFRELSEQEKKQIGQTIHKTQPDIIFVGMSTPKQELWMHDMTQHLHHGVAIGVGAAFDFVAKTKRQAPKWMRNNGLEWLFRLLNEPKRLGIRYFQNNLEFVGLLILSMVRRKPVCC